MSRSACALLLGLFACGTGIGPPPTWTLDVQPIVAARCAGCHSPSGIGPFSFGDYAAVFQQRTAIRAAVGSGLMPPWPPAPGCNQYLYDRSLPDAEKATLLAWLDAGAPQGDPAARPASAPQPAAVGISRVDATLSMAAPYAPQLSPDDYRCFVIDWPETRTKYVTGFNAVPGNTAMVHHVIAFLATPSDVARYQQLDDADPGPGYTCFGDSRGPSFRALGFWVPGSTGADFPSGTGMRVDPGSKLVLQVHYNTLNHAGGTDRTSVQLRLDDAVALQAYTLPWADPGWPKGNMPIPAGQAEVQHTFALDPTPFAAYLTGGVIQPGPVHVYAAAAHQHLRGTRNRLEILRKGGETTCLLDHQRWDFHWQGAYWLKAPEVFNPGDLLRITCHWDNSAANQPVVGGQQLAPADLNWGEGTTDEMCLGMLYVTQ